MIIYWLGNRLIFSSGHLQKINIIEGRRLLNYYRGIATALPHFFRIRGRKNNLLFTFGTRGNTNNK